MCENRGARPLLPTHAMPCRSQRGVFPNSPTAKHTRELGPGLCDLSHLSLLIVAICDLKFEKTGSKKRKHTPAPSVLPLGHRWLFSMLMFCSTCHTLTKSCGFLYLQGDRVEAQLCDVEKGGNHAHFSAFTLSHWV